MTDPLTAVGSAAAILQLATAAATTSMKVYQLVSTIKNAPREIQSLGRDIKDFHTLVQHLSEALKSANVRELIDREKPISRAVADLQYPIGKCELSCRQVESKLGLQLQLDKAEGSGNPDTGNCKKDRVWVRDWMWPIRRKEVYQLISELQRTRLLFSDAMGSLTLYVLEFPRKGAKSNRYISMLILRSSATAMEKSALQRDRQEDAGLKLQQMALTDELSSISLVEQNKKSTDPRYVEELIAAVRRQSILSVELLLQHIDVNARDLRDGRTAVSVAAEIGDVEITKLLIKHGASVNIRQYSLSKRSLGSALNERPLMVSGRLPIYWAVTKMHSAVVKLLLKYGASPNARTTAGRTVIQEACYMNDSTSLRMLLEAGADINGSNLGSVCYILTHLGAFVTDLTDNLGLDRSARSR